MVSDTRIQKHNNKKTKIFYNVLAALGLLFFILSIIFMLYAIEVDKDIYRVASQSMSDDGIKRISIDYFGPPYKGMATFAYVLGLVFSVIGSFSRERIYNFFLIVIGYIIAVECMIWVSIPIGETPPSVFDRITFLLPGLVIVLLGVLLLLLRRKKKIS
jgi:hypothetical protein